jgi:alpha-galactosidase
VRRRQFLAAGAALTASVYVEPLAAANEQVWTVTTGQTSYVIRLRGAAITTDCYAASRDLIELDITDSPAAAAMVLAGPNKRAVSWHATTWHQVDKLTLRIVLAADDYPLSAEVVFAVDPATGLLSRNTTLSHRGIGDAVDIQATIGFWYRVREPIDHMLYLAGSWAHEAQVQHSAGDAPLVLQSRSGKTGFDFQPYLALRTQAAIWLCEIFWSGDWILRAEPTEHGMVLSGGLNDWRLHHRLAPTGTLALPTVLFGRVAGDLNAATQHLHDWRRAHRPDPDRLIPVQFNSWYPYFGEPTAQAMLDLLPVAKRLGCEAFVVDAGWYRTDQGESPAEWDARTGDWRTSHTRFPNGLLEVSAACHEVGMRFGLWFEPEGIGPLSAIRREHPDWLHYRDGKPPTEDQRAVLNFGVPAARRHAFERITRILSTVGVDWMKWDFNADMGSGGWAPGLPDILTDQDPLVAHYLGVYRLQDAIRRWFPDLVLEMCSSGGGRMDGAILSHAHVNWISDQPGALRKLSIHFGIQLAHPAMVCNDWLIEWPPGSIAGYDDDETDGQDERGDLPFRLRVAMLGSFGISSRADRWPEADMATATAHIALYRQKLRPIIQFGDQYLLTPAPAGDGTGDWAAIWYAAKDKSGGVLFAFRLAGADATRVFGLPGLGPSTRYRVGTFGGDVMEVNGAALGKGIAVTVAGQFQSELYVVEALR